MARQTLRGPAVSSFAVWMSCTLNKLQNPSAKLQRNFKLQTPTRGFSPLEIGASLEFLCDRQFQKRNDQLLQFAWCQLQNLVKRFGVSDVEFAGDDAAEFGEVRAAAEFFAEFVGDAAHVGSLGAGEAEFGERFF